VDGRAAAILQLLFRAPSDLSGWRAFFEALAGALSPGGRVITLVETRDPAPSTILFALDGQAIAPGLLPRRTDGKPRIEALPAGTMFELPYLGSRVERHPVVQKLFEPFGLRAGPALGVMLGREGDDIDALLLVVPCTDGWAPSADDRALIAALAPFLPHAALLHDRLAGASALTSLLDHLRMGVILLDDHGHVSYANRSAAELLGVEPGLSDSGGSEQCDARTEALHRIVLANGKDAAGLHHHPVDGRPLQVLESRLDWPRDLSLTGRRFRTALFIGDPEQRAADPFGNLGRLYGLTPAESRLAWLLAGDLSLAEAAAQLGITRSTARTVLKRVLAKTGTRRQASLVRLLFSGPAQVRRDALRGRDPDPPPDQDAAALTPLEWGDRSPRRGMLSASPGR
jgi:DNA-binding CsgD family transcriptional regulator